ncbi:MAG: hypothetical protein PVF60_04890 [Desulfobacterales bacterium]|jgi:hypothetical protein
MIPIRRGLKATSIILFVAIATCFCASKNFLVVNYTLPVEPAIPGESSVSLVFKDYREDPSTVTKSAKKALKDFSGNFTLIVSQENKNDRLAGAFSLHSMIRQIFKSRLENAGIRVASEGQSRETVVEIILKVFKLDLVGRKWVINMTYQANIVRQNRFAAGETVTGSAERMRVVGSKDAEMVIGELITDVVNRLDLSALFKSN